MYIGNKIQTDSILTFQYLFTFNSFLYYCPNGIKKHDSIDWSIF